MLAVKTISSNSLKRLKAILGSIPNPLKRIFERELEKFCALVDQAILKLERYWTYLPNGYGECTISDTMNAKTKAFNEACQSRKCVVNDIQKSATEAHILAILEAYPAEAHDPE